VGAMLPSTSISARWKKLAGCWAQTLPAPLHDLLQQPQLAVTDGVNLLRDFVADPVGRKDRFPSLTIPAGAQPSGHLCFPFSEDCAMLFLHPKCLLSGLSEDSLSNSRIPVRLGISGTCLNPLPSTCFGASYTLDIQLAASSDGTHFRRWREPFVRLGRRGQFDSGMLYMGRGLGGPR